MKAYIIQPPYSADLSKMDEYFDKKLELLSSVPGDADIIVLPEYSDVPCATATLEDTLAAYAKYHGRLMDACREAAVKKQAVIFVNAYDETPTGLRNTTFALDKEGNIAGRYYKRHLPPSELYTLGLDNSYALESEEPYTVQLYGVKYAFLTCYDFYFYELFPKIAKQKVDVIIGCSLQRSDTHQATEIMCRFLAYNTNAYVLRSSVSLDGSADICGASMAVSPDGTVLANMKSEIGVACAEFDPEAKYLKPAGYGNPPSPHHEYIEFGRRPWLYRTAGPAVPPTDEFMPYPRVCAHRGFSTIAPENSLPAFGAAVAMGAEEIEFDLWWTKDGEVVSIHDAVLDRVSDGSGYVFDHTYAELLKYDFGVKHGDKFKGMRIITFEEILKKLACHCVMNVHLKAKDDINPISEEHLKKVIALIRKYDAEKYCYFMSGNPAMLEQLQRLAPDIPRCAGAGADKHENLAEKAIRYDCKKIQLFQPYFSSNPPEHVQMQIDMCHEHGIKVNYFWADDPDEAIRYLEMGVDTILSNDYNRVARAVEEWKKTKQG